VDIRPDRRSYQRRGSHGGLTSGELLDLLVALAPRVGGFALNEVNPLTDAGPKTTILAANLVFQFAVAAAGRNEG